MEKLFGLDMNLIAAALGSALALILAVLALLAWRGRVMFRLGLRPIPRRRTQSALIVLGLMLATLIITAAFVAGDTLSHTLRSMVIEDLGEIDEAIRTTGGQPPYFKIDHYERLAAELNGYDRIDQLVPAVREQIPAVNATRRLSERYLDVLGLRAGDVRILQPGEMTDASGAPLRLDDLAAHEVYLNAVAAKALAAEPGPALAVFWSLPLDAFESLGVKSQNVGPEFFFFSGVFLVTGAVLVLMYNTDLLLWAIGRAQGLPPRIVPVLRMAMAYSLASRFRTGLTLGMFAIVVFSVIFVAALFKTEEIYFANTNTLTGGYDLRIETSYTNPVDNLEEAIAASPHLRQSDYALVASQARAYLEMRRGGGEWYGHMVTGVNTAFLENTDAELLVMAEGYQSSAEVWRALRDRPGTALIDRYSVPSRRQGSYGGGFQFELQGVYAEDETMPSIVVEVRDPATRATFHVTVIGVFEPTSSLYGGLVTSQATLDEGLSFSTPPTTHYIRLAEGVDPTAAGRALESAFLRYGLESTDLLAEVKQQLRSQRVIATLLQGFLTLGLVVGVAALGVISTRAVVERRQQIGMLRALGFRREMVGWSFVLESSFIALLGITLGAALALIPARNLIAYSAQDVPGMHFQIPWDSIALVVAVAYGMTLLTTWLPAVQASRVPPAEALRYE